MKRAAAIGVLAVALAACAPRYRILPMLDVVCNGTWPVTEMTAASRGVRLALRDGKRPFPERATRIQQEGRVTLSCRVAGGVPEACDVVAERPHDFGFAAAAKAAAPLVIYPAAPGSEPVEIVIEFRMLKPYIPDPACPAPVRPIFTADQRE